MVAADFDDAASLKAALEGYSVVFGVTDFWQRMHYPGYPFIERLGMHAGKPLGVVAC